MGKLILLCLFFISFIGFAQNENDYTIYLDSIKKTTTQGNHFYYREVKDYYIRKAEYIVKQYYKSGKLESEGISTDRDFFKGNGEIITYHENGNIQSKRNCVNGIEVGNYSIWYENGKLKEEGTYLENSSEIRKRGVNIIFNYWDTNSIQKVSNGNGFYTDNDKICESFGKITNGLKDGEWKGESKILKFTFTENYKDGKLITGTSTNQNNENFEYTIINENPEPANGINHFYKYIAKNFERPIKYEEKSGRIILRFVINKSGKITNVIVEKGMGFGYDEEAIRVISGYKDWKIGKFRGININTSYAIPILIP
jgi:hypothetical protein